MPAVAERPQQHGAQGAGLPLTEVVPQHRIWEGEKAPFM